MSGPKLGHPDDSDACRNCQEGVHGACTDGFKHVIYNPCLCGYCFLMASEEIKNMKNPENKSKWDLFLDSTEVVARWAGLSALMVVGIDRRTGKAKSCLSSLRAGKSKKDFEKVEKDLGTIGSAMRELLYGDSEMKTVIRDLPEKMK